MTTVFRGLASLRLTTNLPHSLHPPPLYAPTIPRSFTIQTSIHAEPDFKSIKFPRFPLGSGGRAKSSTERRLDRVQEIESCTAPPANFAILSPIPPRPPPGLTPWITNEEAEQYLDPLFSRQWSVARYKPPETKIKVHYQLLSKLFVFQRERDASEFSMGVTQIVNKMAHHPTIHKLRGRQVIFRILTHDAYVRPDEGSPYVVAPGLTMHDIRVAMRIEKLWDKFWQKGRARLPRQGWKFLGRRKLAIRYWGIREARLVSTWRKDLRLTRAWLRKKWLVSQGKDVKPRKTRVQLPKKKTPRWKRMKWRHNAPRVPYEPGDHREDEDVVYETE
ncbi:hypothetical protein BDY19DRAFT_994539 [Irpex rosettiformis]|uniref:Uncharacterized protein n=1 Tax=Irpex rosettiformis TaxID=378272 RepID=A0ACB8U2B1_9APHY|nr:hypothetical protein BDY19DRAFT_994539 [Irpex rosettiformis]